MGLVWSPKATSLLILEQGPSCRFPQGQWGIPGFIRATLSLQQLSSRQLTWGSSLKQKKERGLAIAGAFPSNKAGGSGVSLCEPACVSPRHISSHPEVPPRPGVLTGASIIAPGRLAGPQLPAPTTARLLESTAPTLK